MVMLEKAPQSSPSNGPQITVRLRTRKELETIRRAAKALNVSANTLMSDASVRCAEEILDRVRAEKDASVRRAEEILDRVRAEKEAEQRSA